MKAIYILVPFSCHQMFNFGVKGLICNPAVMQCDRAMVPSALCTSFHFE
jgi:hypothetical protein